MISLKTRVVVLPGLATFTALQQARTSERQVARESASTSNRRRKNVWRWRRRVATEPVSSVPA
jgi:hypothetical protein